MKTMRTAKEKMEKRTKTRSSPLCRHAEMFEGGGWYCPVFDRVIDEPEEIDACNELCDEYLVEDDRDEEE